MDSLVDLISYSKKFGLSRCDVDSMINSFLDLIRMTIYM